MILTVAQLRIDTNLSGFGHPKQMTEISSLKSLRFLAPFPEFRYKKWNPDEKERRLNTVIY